MPYLSKVSFASMTSGLRRASSLLVLFAAVTLVAPYAVSAEASPRVVVSIEDGDTLTVLDAASTQYRVRLAGIDAPERGQPVRAQLESVAGDVDSRSAV